MLGQYQKASCMNYIMPGQNQTINYVSEFVCSDTPSRKPFQLANHTNIFISFSLDHIDHLRKLTKHRKTILDHSPTPAFFNIRVLWCDFMSESSGWQEWIMCLKTTNNLVEDNYSSGRRKRIIWLNKMNHLVEGSQLSLWKCWDPTLRSTDHLAGWRTSWFLKLFGDLQITIHFLVDGMLILPLVSP